MAELAGSIIGIISAGTKVAYILSQLASDVGSAGREARMISGEVRSFCAVLKTLGETLEKIETSQYYSHCSEMVRDMTIASLDMFIEILDAVESLRSMTSGKDGKDGKFGFGRRIQWVVLQKPKILMLRAAMESYKSNLALMLGTLSTAEKVTRRQSLPGLPDLLLQEEQERTLLQSLELDHRASMIDLAQAERQLNEHDAQPSPPHSTLPSGSSSPKPEMEMLFDEQHSGDEHMGDGLIGEARSEVECIRSSLARSFTLDSASIRDQVARHSQRTSILLEEPQKRLSQRWATAFIRGHDGDAPISAKNPMLAALHAPPMEEEDSRPLERTHGLTQTPQYQLFRSWFLQHQPKDQFSCFEALLGEFTSSQAKGQDGLRYPLVQPVAILPDIMVSSTPRVDPRTPIRHTQELLRSIQEQSTGYLGRLLESGGGQTAKGQPFGLNIHLRHRDLEHLSPKVVDSLYRKLTERLSLSWNRLATLPLNLCLCIHLRYLDLSHNNFKDIPDPVFLLHFLRNLDLSHNQLRSVPPQITDMTSLNRLSIAHNNVQVIPLAISRMASLKVLDYNANPIVFPSPDALELCRPSEPDKDGTRAEFSLVRTARLKEHLANYVEDHTTHLGTEPLYEEQDRVPRVFLVPEMDATSSECPSPSRRPRGHRRSCSHEVSYSQNNGVITPPVSPLRRRSHLQDATYKEKRYSTLLTADLSTLNFAGIRDSDDSVRRYVDSVELLSPASQE